MRLPLAALLLLSVAGCLAVPRGIEGFETDATWTALPLRAWLAEGRGEPEAIVACLSPSCPRRLVVAVIALTGAEAGRAAAILRDPRPLVAFLHERDAADREKRRAAIRTDISLRSLGDAGAPGFALTLARRDGERPPAHAAALAQLRGERLTLVIAVGDDDVATSAAARQAAAARFGR